MKRWEPVVAAGFLLLMAGAFALDRAIPRAPLANPSQPASRPLSTGWYCPLPGGEGTTASVSAANLGDEPVRLRVWGAGNSQASIPSERDLAPTSRSSTSTADFELPGAAAVVEAFGPAIAVDSLTSAGRAGVAGARCSLQPWSRWLFAVASSARTQDSYLLVANPFEEEAVIKVRLITQDADIVPSRLSEFVVPQLSQAAILLAEYFPETDLFGVELTATRGRVVVSRFMQVATQEGFRGLALELGVREPSPRLYFAGGEVPDGGDEHIVIMNPGKKESLVQMVFHTEAEEVSPPALKELSVPAGRTLRVPIADHLPRGTRHGTSLISLNGVPVVAERLTFGSLEGVKGVESVLGVPATASRWALSVGSAGSGKDSLAVVNFASSRGLLSITLLTDEGEVRPPELASLPLEGGRRMTIDLSPFVSGKQVTAVVQTTSGSIAAERHLVEGEPYRDFADATGQPL